MKREGDKVVVNFPYDSNFKRTGRLEQIAQEAVAEFGLYSHVWQVKFDDGKEPLIASYNEAWLTKLET